MLRVTMDVGIEGVKDILLIEDNPGDIRLIEEAFSDPPLDPAIHMAKTCEEALDLLHQRGDYEESPRPDLVLLDWNLSRHTGEEVIQVAKSCDPAIPVVVMTGWKSALHRLESSTPAADEYIEKQIDPQGYVAILRSCGVEQ